MPTLEDYERIVSVRRELQEENHRLEDSPSELIDLIKRVAKEEARMSRLLHGHI